MSNRDCSKFHDFLPYVGEFGPYQKRLLMVMMLAGFLYGFTYFGQIFMVLVPADHWCRIEKLETLSKEQQLALGIPKDKEGKFERCLRYDVTFELDELNLTKANESWPKMRCDNGWIYDKNQLPYETIATECNWVCNNKKYGTYSSTTYLLGSVVGCLCFGYISDHCGRVWSLFLANCCALIGGCLSALCKEFSTFATTTFLVGMANDNCFTPIYILTMENVGTKYRAIVGNLTMAFGFPLALAVLPWIAYFLKNWRHFALTIAVPVSILVGICSLLPESPSWLLSIGKIDRGMKGLRKVAKINGKQLTDGEWLEMQLCFELISGNQPSAVTYSFLHLFKSFRRAGMILLLIVNWAVLCLVYDAHVRIISSLDTDVFITFSVVALVEIPAGILPLVLVDRVGRKPVMISALLLCSIFSFSVGMLRGMWEIAIASLFARFFATVAINVGQQWDVEILPTMVRGQGWAVINVLGRLGALLSPLVIYTKNFYHSLPMFIITLVAIIGAVAAICLPETKGISLPQTLEEAEKRWTLCLWKRKVNETMS